MTWTNTLVAHASRKLSAEHALECENDVLSWAEML
jgi:hypothetical protein